MTTDPTNTTSRSRILAAPGDWRTPRDSSITHDDFMGAANALLPAELAADIEHFTPWWDDETPGGFSEPFIDGVALTLVGADFLSWRSRHRHLFPAYDENGPYQSFAAIEQAWALLDGAAARSVEIDLIDPAANEGLAGIVVTTLGASAEIPDQTINAVSDVLAPKGFTLLALEEVMDTSSINQGSDATPIGYLWDLWAR